MFINKKIFQRGAEIPVTEELGDRDKFMFNLIAMFREEELALADKFAQQLSKENPYRYGVCVSRNTENDLCPYFVYWVFDLTPLKEFVKK